MTELQTCAGDDGNERIFQHMARRDLRFGDAFCTGSRDIVLTHGLQHT